MTAACFKARQVLNFLGCKLANSSSLKRNLWTSFAELRMGLKQMWQPLKNTHEQTEHNLWTREKRKPLNLNQISQIWRAESSIFLFSSQRIFWKKFMSLYFISSFFQITPDFFQTGQLAQTKPQTGQFAISLVFEILASILATNHNPYLFKN